MRTRESVVSPRRRIAVAVAAALAATLAGAPPAAAQGPADLTTELVTGGLSSPVAIRHAGDGSGRLFIVEQGGTIRIWDGTQLLPTPFLDLSTLVSDDSEQGLLGLAFHPDYETNGRFYVSYTEDDPSPPADCDPSADCLWNSVVARYLVSAGDPNVANAASGLPILRLNQDFENHNGGNILFGPDGFLYVGFGDGGSGGDPLDRAQSLDTLLGKMLRVDVDGSPPPPPGEVCGEIGNYGIPPDNPFAGATPGCDEIWSSGLRNPWRWSFDRRTGDLLIGDVGQTTIEEIDFEPGDSPGGVNWGWPCFEGNNPFDPGAAGCPPPAQLEFPILEYNHGLGCSVTGGYRYRGHAIGGFDGVYVYGDFCSGRILFGTESGGGSWSSSVWMLTPFDIASFGEDEGGEIYIADIGGAIHRLVSPGAIFADGFESGDTAAWQ